MKEQFKPVKRIEAHNISIVIPVKNNQEGVNRFLEKFVEVTDPVFYPKEIIVVDNNSDILLKIQRQVPVNIILKFCKKPGPAAARNTGIKSAGGEWILFTDSDCIPTSSTISGYCMTGNRVLGYAGGIEVVSSDLFSNYYKAEKILIPPEAKQSERTGPVYLVTANCLVQREAILEVGGFDDSFKQAGGEDVDLAYRLLEIGALEYRFESLTRHEFEDTLSGFVKRFIRYGRGNRQLSSKYNKNLRPGIFIPRKRTIGNVVLAQIQFVSMLYGYLRGALK